MTDTSVAIFDDNDDVDAGLDEKTSKLAKQRQRMRAAYREGGLDVLEQFVPGILDAMARSHELLPKLFDLVDDAITRKDTAALKDAAPLLKMLLDENKRLMDRRFGTSVQRTQNEHNVKVQHVSLRGLIEQRKLAQDEAATTNANQTDEHVVEAEVIHDGE